jgi:hypothetical protein
MPSCPAPPPTPAPEGTISTNHGACRDERQRDLRSRSRQLMTELQSSGCGWLDPGAGVAEPARWRRAVGPQGRDGRRRDDHGAGAHLDRVALAVRRAGADASGTSALMRGTIPIANISFPKRRASMHADLRRRAVLAHRHAARRRRARDHGAADLHPLREPRKTCKFCAIGQSLAAGRTIARKTPEQLAEVARAAVLLDGVKHMVLTTGTPPTQDRGAQILCESAFAIKARSICRSRAMRAARRRPLVRPHEGERHRHAWYAPRSGHARGARTHHAGQGERAAVALHESFKAAVAVFGRGQVSTYILAGLGDTPKPF